MPIKSSINQKWFFFFLLTLTFLGVILLFKPFLAVLIVGASFAVVLHPLYRWLQTKRVPAGLAAILTVLLFGIALGIPVFGIGTLVFHQSQDVYQQLVQGRGMAVVLDNINQSIQSILPQGASVNLREYASNAVSFFVGNVAKIFTSTLSTLFAVLLMFISLFYFLKDGSYWVKEAIAISPLADRDDEKILSKLARSIDGVLKGYLLIAVIQGVLLGLGLAIFGVPNPALWGLVAMFTSLLPTIGTAFVSAPAILFLAWDGSLWSAVGLLIWSVLLVGMVDNFLSPFVVGKRIHIPPLFILFSVLGGITVLGPVGLLVGPLMVSLFHTLITIYRNDVA